ncbi:MAG: secretin N-terminal domain-containing protein, partial [Microbacteriaceae bacterium]
MTDALRVPASSRRARKTLAAQALAAGVLWLMSHDALAATVKVTGVSVRTSGDRVQLVLTSDGPLTINATKFEAPLRVALDLENASLPAKSFPKMVDSPPVLQIVETPFGEGKRNTRIEVVLLTNAEYWLETTPTGAVLDLRASDVTLARAAQAQSNAKRVISNVSGSDAPALAANQVMMLTGEQVKRLQQAAPDATQPSPEADGFVAPKGMEAAPAGAPPVGSTPAGASVPPSAVPPAAKSNLGSLMARDPSDNTSEPDPSKGETQSFFSGGDVSQPGVERYSGSPITLNLKSADLLDVLRNISDITGFNIVLDPGVRGIVTIRLEDVPWDQALDIILKNNNLGRTFEGNVMRVATLEKLKQEEQERFELEQARQKTQPLVAEVVYISYANASDIVNILRPGLSPRGTLAVDERTNSVIVTDNRRALENMKKYIRILDRRTRQVSINSRIVTATKNFSRN